ncbi:hypothetical protein P8452_38463 [Trifolium repens]|nr:hypothetical protein P8452_38463 [Trifolium repens]
MGDTPMPHLLMRQDRAATKIQIALSFFSSAEIVLELRRQRLCGGQDEGETASKEKSRNSYAYCVLFCLSSNSTSTFVAASPLRFGIRSTVVYVYMSLKMMPINFHGSPSPSLLSHL